MFTLKYKPDPGLDFLQFCSHEEIKSLADILIKTGGRAEEISSSDEFIKNKENFTKCWPLIAAELQKFGGNSISNVARFGKGVFYQEIVNDVCGSLGVEFENLTLTEKENAVLLKALSASLCAESAIELFKRRTKQYLLEGSEPITFKDCLSSESFLAYEVALIFIEKIIQFAARHELMNRLPIPIYNNNQRMWGLVKILAGPLIALGVNQANPAFRVTIPSVIQVAFLRRCIVNKDIL